MRVDLVLFVIATLIAVALFISYKTKPNPGPTPVEVVLTSALIICLISGITVNISLNINFSETRNAQRSNDVYQIANALNLYYGDSSKDSAPIEDIPSCPILEEIGIVNGSIKLYDKLSREYLVNFPIDPSNGDLARTGYFICQDSGRFKVAAPYAENGKIIQMTI